MSGTTRKPGDKGLLPWLVLKSAPGLSNRMIKRLLDRFGDAEAVLASNPRSWRAVARAPEKAWDHLARRQAPEESLQEVAAAVQKGQSIVTYADSAYPPLLREIPDPPPFLFVLGRLPAGTRNVALVGSRTPSPYGVSTAFSLGRDLARAGVCVVSGMARGIDTKAHEGALAGDGSTVAVLGSGLDVVYPPENRGIASAIAERGAVVSEFPPGTGPKPYHFPMRNRIIAGMSAALVVVEAAARSGALITAQMAADANREVFAVPGSVQSAKSAGTNNLIKQGAGLVENAADVLSQMEHVFGFCQDRAGKAPGPALEKLPPPALAPEELPVWEALSAYPEPVDEISRRLAMDVPTLLTLLLTMEIRGLVRQAPGKLFSRGS
ncbi:MAG: DNA-processing protein DprA [Thermodesulfobacteriota bacterium]